MSILVFDIETIPDVDALKQLGLVESTDYACVEAYLATRESFLPPYLQKVVSIGCALRFIHQKQPCLRVACLGETQTSEAELIQTFFDLIDRYQPQLVSWNGSGFDLPVLQQRGFMHGVKAVRYWDMGERDEPSSKAYKYNNYISRYHLRHIDLMDILASYQPRANPPLDAMAKLSGLPGKIGIGGAHIYAAHHEGRLQEIRHYCEVDVLNTYMLFQKFQRMRYGDDAAYAQELDITQQFLAQQDAAHWQEYAHAWDASVSVDATTATIAASISPSSI